LPYELIQQSFDLQLPFPNSVRFIPMNFGKSDCTIEKADLDYAPPLGESGAFGHLSTIRQITDLCFSDAEIRRDVAAFMNNAG